MEERFNVDVIVSRLSPSLNDYHTNLMHGIEDIPQYASMSLPYFPLKKCCYITWKLKRMN